MKRCATMFLFVVGLLMPLRCNAQKLGQIECGRQEGYAYLYSSLTTMEIRTTLKCGQRVTVLDRSDNFVRVRIDTGDEGFVPLNNVAFLKPGAARLAAASHPAALPQEILLPNQMAVHLKLGRELSSATAKVGEEVNFEVSEDVIVNGHLVIAKGAPAAGAVTEAAPKGRMGKAGKLNLTVTSVQLADSEKAPLRSFGIDTSTEQKSGLSLPLAHGKDVTLAQGAEMTAYVDGDQHLAASKFAPAPASAPAQSANSNP